MGSIAAQFGLSIPSSDGLNSPQFYPELVRSPQSREPADEETKQIVRFCYEHGVIVLSTGSYGNVIRLLMPLVITDAQFDEALTVLESALSSVLQRKDEAVVQNV